MYVVCCIPYPHRYPGKAKYSVLAEPSLALVVWAVFYLGIVVGSLGTSAGLGYEIGWGFVVVCWMGRGRGRGRGLDGLLYSISGARGGWDGEMGGWMGRCGSYRGGVWEMNGEVRRGRNRRYRRYVRFGRYVRYGSYGGERRGEGGMGGREMGRWGDGM